MGWTVAAFIIIIAQSCGYGIGVVIGGVSELILTSHCSATRGLLATDHVILNHGQVTWTTPELAAPLRTTTPHQREGTFQLSTDLTCIAALHGGSLVVLGSNS
ncbi:uncharacterized protein TNCV_4747271 [Trichonephila clavipes]|nr:uncharacterized protein TNCV_4747271 [Trichonephila clavipes]